MPARVIQNDKMPSPLSELQVKRDLAIIFGITGLHPRAGTNIASGEFSGQL